jgi:hypothetical protein
MGLSNGPIRRPHHITFLLTVNRQELEMAAHGGDFGAEVKLHQIEQMEVKL